MSDKHSRWISVLRDTMVMQGDSQLISGLTIIIASLVNVCIDDETPLYHIFIARSLADICLTGHSANIILLARTEHNWTFRLGLLLCTIDLWEFWSYAAIERFQRWDGETLHCLENDSVIPGDYEHWIILSLAWMPLGYIPFLLNILESGLKLIEKFEKCVITYPLCVIEHARGSAKAVQLHNISSRASIYRSDAMRCISGLRRMNPSVMHSTPGSICDLSVVGHLRNRQSACCQCAHHRGKP